MLKAWLHDAGRLRAAFLAVMSLLAAVLAGLGWKLLDQERQLEAARELQWRDAGGAVVVATLERRLTGWQQQLGRAIADPAAAEAAAASGALVVRFASEQLEAWPSGRLVYSPAVPLRTVSDRDAAALAAEAARAILDQRFDTALTTYQRLEQMGERPVAGMPAALATRIGRVLLYERAGNSDAVLEEARALRDDLSSARWPIGADTFDYLTSIVADRLGEADGHMDEARALAEAVAWLWTAWSEGRGRFPSGWITHEAPAGSLLLVWHVVDDRMAALVGTEAFIAQAVLPTVAAAARESGVQFAARDDRRRIASTITRAGAVSELAPGVTGLPWTLEIVSARDDVGLASRRRLLMAGVAVTALVILAGAWAVGRSMTRELEAARLKSDFVAAVSHEFRTPLTTLCQLSELLMGGRVATDADRQEYYALLHRESDRLRRLVEGLLTFGRLDAGTAELRLEPVDLPDALRRWAGEFGQAIDLSGHRLRVEARGTIPPVAGDEDALKSVFWNLFENAVKYSPAGGDISVGIAATPAGVEVSVRDQGVGIPDVEQRRVFEPFARGTEARTRQIRGSGIGLAIARAIVRAHGGDVRVESTPGRGSTFTVHLPFPASEAAHA